jgi:capsid protein
MPALGAAIAASVTAVTMTYLPNMQEEQGISPGASVQQVAMVETSPQPQAALQAKAPEAVSLSAADWKTIDQNSELASKLNDYIVNHREFASPMGVAPVGPYALNVRYDGGR